jgi:hypothetical protein
MDTSSPNVNLSILKDHSSRVAFLHEAAYIEPVHLWSIERLWRAQVRTRYYTQAPGPRQLVPTLIHQRLARYNFKPLDA